MKIAFIIYNDMTTLDFVGVYDPITRLKTMGFLSDLEYDVCSRSPRVRSFEGLEIKVDKTPESLADYDYIVIPGGSGVAALMNDTVYLEWIRSVSSNAIVTALCGGVLVLGAAGMLQGKRVTTHPNHFKLVETFGALLSVDRVVEDGLIITAGGVTSAIDLGLYICEKLAGSDVRDKIQKQMDYPYYTAS
ncbi:MAG: DJ-1/PfpI family protein [Candidatus Saccharibacteria bacterium]